MIVIAQDSSAIYDLEKCIGVCAEADGGVFIIPYTGEEAFWLGSYNSQDRAKEVVEEIFVMIGSQGKYEMPVI